MPKVKRFRSNLIQSEGGVFLHIKSVYNRKLKVRNMSTDKIN